MALSSSLNEVKDGAMEDEGQEYHKCRDPLPMWEGEITGKLEGVQAE